MGSLALALIALWGGLASASPASVVYRGSSERKEIALTFDDNTNVTRALATLRALEREKIPATLFVIGSAVKAYSSINAEIVKGMALGLFEVGDHTWSHPVLPKVSSLAMTYQIGGGTDAFREATGARTVPLFRPPYGSTDSRVAAVAGSEGFRHLVLWDVDPRDWAGGSATTIADHVVGHAHNGAIVVMHLSAPHTAEAIAGIASRLRAKGYQLVTVSTMLKGDRLFVDVEAGSEIGQAIARLVGEGFMNGYDGNYFGPGDTITRAQVAKVATLVGGLHTSDVERVGSPTFADVRPLFDSQGGPVPYPFDFVEEAAAAGLVEGSPGPGGAPVFNPNGAITRVQLAQILARMARQLKGYGLEPPAQPATFAASAQAGPPALGAAAAGGEMPAYAFGDVPAYAFGDVPEYAAADVALVVSLGLMSGYSAQRFGPWEGAQRGHVALTMSRYLDLPDVRPAG